jgi:surfeit locus 1 family protein
MNRPPLWATILTLAAIAVLCALGTWQAERLQWKRGLLARIEAAYGDKNPPELDYAGILEAARTKDDFIAARLAGHFTAAPAILLGVRTWRGQPGYHALAVLEMPGGAILVNRGWVPSDSKGAAPPAGPVTVRGVLHRPERDNLFVPQNDPARGKWYRWDLAQMAQAAGESKLAPVVLYEEGEEGGEDGADHPERAALVWNPPNNHLGYALFWYATAFTLAVIYYLRFIRKTN